MKWQALLSLLGSEPLFHSSLLFSGLRSEAGVRRQLVRWVDAGRLFRLGRGLYAIAPPYRTVTVHPFVVANRLKPASYVSLQSALSHWGLIPEHVPLLTSVTTGRPERRDTPLGSFSYRHINRGLFYGYRVADLGGGASALVAGPEKALLDLVHLTPSGDSPEYLLELRLQNLEGVDARQLLDLASRGGSPKLARAAGRLAWMIGAERDR